jgi:hypothetical protein
MEDTWSKFILTQGPAVVILGVVCWFLATRITAAVDNNSRKIEQLIRQQILFILALPDLKQHVRQMAEDFQRELENGTKK